MKKLCSICVRKGSKGVKNKNLKELFGKPLLAHSVEHAVKSGIFDHVVVSSDSDELLAVAKEYGADIVVKRPDELAQDTTPKLGVIKHCLLEVEKEVGYQFDIAVDIDATSPLRLPEDIVNAVNLLIEKDADNVLTAMPSRRSPYFNMIELDENEIAKLSKVSTVSRRQDCPKSYDMNASIYVWKRDVLVERTDTLFLENTRLYVMPEERSFDIDTPFDFKLVEFLMKETRDE